MWWSLNNLLLSLVIPTHMRQITAEEVAKHNSAESCWVIIHGKVYDLTSFLPAHPGGQKIILKEAGKDGSKAFDAIHSIDVIERLLKPENCLGEIVESAEAKKIRQLEKSTKLETELQEWARNERPPLSAVINTFDFEVSFIRVF